MSEMTEPAFLERQGVRLAYRSVAGRAPGVFFCSGFRSDMTGSKATALDAWARETGHACTRFDYRGHGQSGGDFLDGTIGAWVDDALAVFDRATSGPQIVIGSSMGGWIALLLALRRPERVAGLIGIAAAPDFTEDLIWDRFDASQRARLAETGVVELVEENGGEPEPFTRALIEDGRTHLLLRAPIPLAMPIRLIQGMNDQSVPWSTALRLTERLPGDVHLTLVKDGDHRLSRPKDLALLRRTLEGMIVDVAG
jgi:pimeloyl-ACP methyl ester carboxylesterase